MFTWSTTRSKTRNRYMPTTSSLSHFRGFNRKQP